MLFDLVDFRCLQLFYAALYRSSLTSLSLFTAAFPAKHPAELDAQEEHADYQDVQTDVIHHLPRFHQLIDPTIALRIRGNLRVR
jgi:hypothetical protein